MATISKRTRKDGTVFYTAQIRLKKGGEVIYSFAQSFDRESVAKAWLKKKEAELAKPDGLEKARVGHATIGDAIKRFVKESSKAMGKTKAQVLLALTRDPIASMACVEVKSEDLVALARRLGEDKQGPRVRRIPLSSAEQVQLERLQQMQPGAWFEFTTPAGEQVRRRLAWLSAGTGQAMFVNQRGQKNAEYPLEGLARMLAKGTVRIVEEDKGKVIDRAWDNVLNALRSFAVPTAGTETPK